MGFGPRDCSDYNTGISVIPISRLTDADRKWALTAVHGGTGGRPLEGGMVLEEPDIEIGAGVSSKGTLLSLGLKPVHQLTLCSHQQTRTDRRRTRRPRWLWRAWRLQQWATEAS